MENRKKAFFSFLTALNCRGNCSFGQILKWMLLIKNFVDKKQCAQATYYERLIWSFNFRLLILVREMRKS